MSFKKLALENIGKNIDICTRASLQCVIVACGAQWPSGRVPDSRSSCQFLTRLWVLASPPGTALCPSASKTIDWDVKNQIKQ